MLPFWCCIELLGLKVTEESLGSRTVCPPIFSLFVLQCSDILNRYPVQMSCLVLPWRPPVWEHNHLFLKSVVEEAFLKSISSYTLCFHASKLLFHATEGGRRRNIKYNKIAASVRQVKTWLRLNSR